MVDSRCLLPLGKDQRNDWVLERKRMLSLWLEEQHDMLERVEALELDTPGFLFSFCHILAP